MLLVPDSTRLSPIPANSAKSVSSENKTTSLHNNIVWHKTVIPMFQQRTKIKSQCRCNGRDNYLLRRNYLFNSNDFQSVKYTIVSTVRSFKGKVVVFSDQPECQWHINSSLIKAYVNYKLKFLKYMRQLDAHSTGTSSFKQTRINAIGKELKE